MSPLLTKTTRRGWNRCCSRFRWTTSYRLQKRMSFCGSTLLVWYVGQVYGTIIVVCGKLQCRVCCFQGCPILQVPYHLAIEKERWQDIFDEVRKSSVDMTAVTTNAMYDPVLGGSVLVPKLEVQNNKYTQTQTDAEWRQWRSEPQPSPQSSSSWTWSTWQW